MYRQQASLFSVFEEGGLSSLPASNPSREGWAGVEKAERLCRENKLHEDDEEEEEEASSQPAQWRPAFHRTEKRKKRETRGLTRSKDASALCLHVFHAYGTNHVECE